MSIASHDPAAAAARRDRYVAQFVASIGGDLAGASLDRSTRDQVFAALSHQEEIGARRDQWDNWDWPFGAAHRRGDLFVPWLDELLLDTVGDAAERPGIWPGGRRFALCLTHDVDGTNWTRPARAMRRRLRGALGSLDGGRRFLAHLTSAAQRRLDPDRGGEALGARELDAWVDLEARLGFRSTFLVFPPGVRDPHPLDCSYAIEDEVRFRHEHRPLVDILREISRSGWEVGLHGSYQSAMAPGRLAAERASLERALDFPVTSMRQHYLHWDASVTPRLQASAGLRADSTAGFNRSVGFRAGTSFPYWCWDHEAEDALPVLEIPQHIMDGGLFESNSLNYDADLAIGHCVEMMDAVERVGGCLTLNFHPDHVRKERYWQTWVAVLEEAKRRDAWGATMEEVRRWWTSRTAPPLTVETAA